MGQKMWALTRRCRKTSVVRLAESGRQRQRTPVWMHGSSLDVCSKSISVAGCLDDGKSSGRLLSLKMLEAFVQALITFYTGISVVSSEVGDFPFFILAAPCTPAHRRLPGCRPCLQGHVQTAVAHVQLQQLRYIYIYMYITV